MCLLGLLELKLRWQSSDTELNFVFERAAPSCICVLLLEIRQDGAPACQGTAVRALCTPAERCEGFRNSKQCLQRSEQQQFLFETTVQATVKEVLASVVSIHNLRQTVTKLKLEGGELAKYGPAKNPDKQGIDTYDENSPEKGEFYTMDPTGRRTGNGKAMLIAYMSVSVPRSITCSLHSFTACSMRSRAFKGFTSGFGRG